jgi:hypothetical protein
VSAEQIITALEQELCALERDVATLKERYNTLLMKHEKLKDFHMDDAVRIAAEWRQIHLDKVTK